MQNTLAGIGLGVGVLVAGLSYFQARLGGPLPGVMRPRFRAGLALGVVLVITFFLLTLPKAAPFSPGQSLGLGFLIGGLFALVGAFLSARLINPERAYWPYPVNLLFSAALAALSLTLLLFQGNPGDALIGCALGIVLLAGIFRLIAASPATGENAEVSLENLATAAEAMATFAVTLAAGSLLAIYHFNQNSQRGWWTYLLALAGFWLIGQAISYAVTTRQATRKYPLLPFSVAAIAAAALLLIAGNIVGRGLNPGEALLSTLAVGIVSAALIAWLALSAPAAQASWPRALQASALAALLALFLIVLTFKLQAGFGAAVALVAAWGIAAPAFAGRSRVTTQALALGASYLLLRLFLERVSGAMSEFSMSFHYTLVGAVLGILLPFIYSALHLRPGLGRALLLGAVVALSPVVVMALWGPDAMLGLLAGLVGAQALSLLLAPLGKVAPALADWQAPTSLLALLMGLIAFQFSQAFYQLYEISRMQKAYLAGAIALLVILWALIAGLAQSCRRGQSTPASAPISGQEG